MSRNIQQQNQAVRILHNIFGVSMSIAMHHYDCMDNEGTIERKHPEDFNENIIAWAERAEAKGFSLPEFLDLLDIPGNSMTRMEIWDKIFMPVPTVDAYAADLGDCIVTYKPKLKRYEVVWDIDWNRYAFGDALLQAMSEAARQKREYLERQKDITS